MMKRTLGILFSLVVLTTQAVASPIELLLDGTPSISITFRNSYDSNILRLSEPDRTKFESMTELSSQPITTMDDLRQDVKLSLDYTVQLFSGLDSRVLATGQLSSYMRNGVKNGGWLSTSAFQDVNREIRLSLNHFYQPHFYLRAYKDVNTNTYQYCDYATSQTKGDARYRFRINKRGTWVDLSGGVRYKMYAYNGYFTEYDNTLLEYTGDIIFRTKEWRLNATYAFSTSDNVGFRETEVSRGDLTLEDSDLGDGDYQEDSYGVSVRYTTVLLDFPVYLQVDGSLSDRYYQTTRPSYLDPLHTGRNDVSLGYGANGEISLTEELDIAIGAEYGSRRSSAPAPVVERVKNHDRWGGWIEFSYQLW